mmetsp:Transcript_47870/g.124252  ORF Transcript_47870/g.124252 Transcript_47870/m.124252 type:complete len:122 (-) Transcript_47870:444-809(-)
MCFSLYASSKVLMLGLAYKPNIDDVRESPAFPIWELLLENGAEVEFSDAHVDEVPYMREHANFAGRKGVSWDEESIKDFDAVLVVTNHEKASVDVLRNFKGLVVDTRNWVPRDWGLDLVRS